jgi:hypothetical protein
MKGEVMGRAIQIILMFQVGPVTSAMIREKFQISHNSANRWIMQACRYMPVVETGVDGSGFGRPCKKYELMR